MSGCKCYFDAWLASEDEIGCATSAPSPGPHRRKAWDCRRWVHSIGAVGSSSASETSGWAGPRCCQISPETVPHVSAQDLLDIAQDGAIVQAGRMLRFHPSVLAVTWRLISLTPSGAGSSTTSETEIQDCFCGLLVRQIMGHGRAIDIYRPFLARGKLLCLLTSRPAHWAVRLKKDVRVISRHEEKAHVGRSWVYIH